MFSALKALLLWTGIFLAKSENYEEAIPLLIISESAVSSKSFSSYYFYRGVCEYSLRDKTASLKSFKNIENSFGRSIPRRYSIVSDMLIEDMSRWEEAGLDDIGRRMKEVSNRLDKGKAGDITKARQDEIIALLDKKIKEIEDAEKSKSKLEGNGSQSEKSSGKPSKGSEDSKPGEDEKNKGIVDIKRMIDSGEWGKLPHKEREKIILELSKKLPAKYQKQVEDYNKELNKLRKN